jgi:putative flavoprotein involved in K+ transport
VLATGMSGVPSEHPHFPGMESFKGEQQHSSQHPGPDAYRGKKVVVVGSNNSAHDICAALWENEADVTMVQRSSTHIVKSDTLMEVGARRALLRGGGAQNGITTDKADLIFASIPYGPARLPEAGSTTRSASGTPSSTPRLEKAGFWLDLGADDSGCS